MEKLICKQVRRPTAVATSSCHTLEAPLVTQEKYIVVMVTAVSGHHPASADSDNHTSPRRLLRRRATAVMTLSSGLNYSRYRRVQYSLGTTVLVSVAYHLRRFVDD